MTLILAFVFLHERLGLTETVAFLLLVLGTVVITMAKDQKNKKAYEVGKKLAKIALKLKIKKVIFDRGGFLYHGRIKKLANGARNGGLKF